MLPWYVDSTCCCIDHGAQLEVLSEGTTPMFESTSYGEPEVVVRWDVFFVK
jgi:hypothetical protein